MDCSMRGFPVFLHFLDLTQTHVHWDSDCYLIISSSAVLLFFCLQYFPELGYFPMSCLFISGGQSNGASTSVSVPPINIQCWCPVGFTSLIFLLSKGLSRVFSNTIIQKYRFFIAQSSLWSNSHIHDWLLEIPQLWLYGPLWAKWCLIFNMLSRLVIAFLSRKKKIKL